MPSSDSVVPKVHFPGGTSGDPGKQCGKMECGVILEQRREKKEGMGARDTTSKTRGQQLEKFRNQCSSSIQQ